MSLAILAAAGALTLCTAPHPSNPCQVDIRECPGLKCQPSVTATLDTTSAQPVTMSMDATASLSMAYPPCGTPEAKTTAACIKWVVVPCPATRTMWSPVLPPIGCDPSVLVRIIPGETR